MGNTRYITEDSQSTILRVLVILVLYFIIRGAVRRSRQIQVQNEAMKGVDPVTGQNSAFLALMLHQSFNPSGISFFEKVDGTDEAIVFNTSRKIKDFSLVAKAYRDLYKSDLVSDLERELDPYELEQFRYLLGKGGDLKMGFAKTNLNVYSVDEKSGYPNVNDVLASHKLGDFVGYITGNIYVFKPESDLTGNYYEVQVPRLFGIYSKQGVVKTNLIVPQ